VGVQLAQARVMLPGWLRRRPCTELLQRCRTATRDGRGVAVSARDTRQSGDGAVEVRHGIAARYAGLVQVERCRSRSSGASATAGRRPRFTAGCDRTVAAAGEASEHWTRRFVCACRTSNRSTGCRSNCSSAIGPARRTRRFAKGCSYRSTRSPLHCEIVVEQAHQRVNKRASVASAASGRGEPAGDQAAHAIPADLHADTQQDERDSRTTTLYRWAKPVQNAIGP